MPEYILLVDENDKVIGKEEKMKCHKGKGILHRAFTAMVFNRKNELLLTKEVEIKNYGLIFGMVQFRVMFGRMKVTKML